MAIELLLKSTYDSENGTSIATSKAMDVIVDPDSAFEAYLRSGEVSLADLSPVERLGGFGPFAAWTAKACSQYFYGEVPKTATAMFKFVEDELTFLSPSGALSLHAPYLKLCKFLTLCNATGAEFCNSKLLLGVAYKLELAGEGHSAEFDGSLDRVYEKRHPYRFGGSAPPPCRDRTLRYARDTRRCGGSSAAPADSWTGPYVFSP